MGGLEFVPSRILRSLDALSVRMRIVLACATLLIVLLFVGIFMLFVPPLGAGRGHVLAISPGEAAGTVATDLAHAHIIWSADVFKAYLRLQGRGTTLQTGTYEFLHPYGLTTIVHDLSLGTSDLKQTRVTFPEGQTAHEMALTLSVALMDFDAATFEKEARAREGYLFPDTYFFMPGTSPDAVVQRLTDTFDVKIRALVPNIAVFGKPLSDVVIMASILEREGKTTADRRIIAGILWKRLAKGMPLQTDATLGYVHQQSGYMPTAADLKLDSPYNTYLHAGLPPTPIANPGLDALTDAVTPTKTNYVYYLTGKDGTMHYARTLEEQKANEAKYLN